MTVVSANLKSSWYGMMFSPSLITREPLGSLYTWLASTGSKKGSRASSTFSSSTGWPSRIAISRVCTCFLVESEAFIVLIWSLARESFRKRLACVCGSIMRGHRLVIDMMRPFSTLNESAGSPAMFHCRICTGLPRILPSVHSGVHGTPSFLSESIHVVTSAWR